MSQVLECKLVIRKIIKELTSHDFFQPILGQLANMTLIIHCITNGLSSTI